MEDNKKVSPDGAKRKSPSQVTREPHEGREWLRQGDIVDIAAACGCATQYVTDILRGARGVNGERAVKARLVNDEIWRVVNIRKEQPKRTRGKSGQHWKKKGQEQASE